MRVFMLGWEFPPFISGGLGTACYGLTKGLDHIGTEVLFVLPRGPEHLQPESSKQTSEASQPDKPTDLRRPEAFRYIRFRTVDAVIRPYVSPGVEDEPEPTAAVARRTKRARAAAGPREGVRVIAAQSTEGPGGHYAGDLFTEVERYAALACEIAAGEDEFDLVHAHDWMTYQAGIAVADMTGKPLVVHVHSTEFDRSGLHVNQRIYDIERAGMTRAQRVICVSHFTRSLVLQHYGVDPLKVDVVYNAVDENGAPESRTLPPIAHDEKIVLFLGRITMQKGPEYFLAAAKRVLEVIGNVRFIMAGSGDMTRRMIELANQMGIGHKVLFTGFLRGDDVRRVFRMADLYVMPSVSEPFGIAPLEALANDVPVLISKQSGVSEILSHALKVDFWDVDEMANKIIAVLRHPPLQATLRDHGSIEVRRLSWVDSARSCLKVYENAVNPA
jgi:glycogen synthase